MIRRLAALGIAAVIVAVCVVIAIATLEEDDDAEDANVWTLRKTGRWEQGYHQ